MHDTLYKKSQEGQALLVIVLVMAVALTVGLSVASRSITNLRNTTDQAESQKAFSAAEAGIEQALQSTTTTGKGLFEGTIGDSVTKKKVNIADIAGTEILVQGGTAITQDKGADIWLVQPDAATGIIPSSAVGWPSSGTTAKTLTIYWDKNASGCDAALELIVLSLKGGTLPLTTRYAYDCDGGVNRRQKNNFSTPAKGGDVNGVSFLYSTDPITIPLKSGLIIRVVPLYGNTVVGVKTDGVALPPQGKQIDSTGTSGSTQRKISVFQGYPQLPQELFNGIFIIGNDN